MTQRPIYSNCDLRSPRALVIKLILLLLVLTDTWQTTKCVRVQRLREGLQNGGHRDPLVRWLEQLLVLLLTL
jgi:hypothetical protein